MIQMRLFKQYRVHEQSFRSFCFLRALVKVMDCIYSFAKQGDGVMSYRPSKFSDVHPSLLLSQACQPATLEWKPYHLNPHEPTHPIPSWFFSKAPISEKASKGSLPHHSGRVSYGRCENPLAPSCLPKTGRMQPTTLHAIS